MFALLFLFVRTLTMFGPSIRSVSLDEQKLRISVCRHKSTPSFRFKCKFVCVCVCVAQTWNQFNLISEFDCLLVKSATSTCLITFMISPFSLFFACNWKIRRPTHTHIQILISTAADWKLVNPKELVYRCTCRLNIHFIHVSIQKYFCPGYSYCL